MSPVTPADTLTSVNANGTASAGRAWVGPGGVCFTAAGASGTSAARNGARAGNCVLTANTSRPPSTAMAQVPAAKAAMPRRPTTRARPQNVIGPPAAAANSRAALGAAPAPSTKSSATSGISNSSGTLISTPRVAAASTPSRLLPR